MIANLIVVSILWVFVHNFEHIPDYVLGKVSKNVTPVDKVLSILKSHNMRGHTSLQKG